jgi:hypothetical protein
MMNTLVVARYNENVDWVCAVPDSFWVYIELRALVLHDRRTN